MYMVEIMRHDNKTGDRKVGLCRVVKSSTGIQNKGYGFIDVDNQSEDVFFHGSKVRLSQPITVGQSVYFNSERNDKNQLRATEVTSNELSILATPDSNIANHHPNTNSRNNPTDNNKNPRHTTRDNRHSQRGNQNKRKLRLYPI